MELTSLQDLSRPHTIAKTVAFFAIARGAQSFPALIHIDDRHLPYVAFVQIIAIPVRRDALAVRTVGAPFAYRLVVFVIRPLR